MSGTKVDALKVASIVDEVKRNVEFANYTFGVEKTSTIGNFRQGKGFTSLKAEMQRIEGVNDLKDLSIITQVIIEALEEIIKKDPTSSGINFQKLTSFKKISALRGNSLSNYFSHVEHRHGSGGISRTEFGFRTLQHDPDKIYWYVITGESTYELSADSHIMKESKKGFLKKSTKETIVLTQRSLTTDDVMDLRNIALVL